MSDPLIPTIDDGTYHGLAVDGGHPSSPASLVQVRRGKAAQWSGANPALKDGETGRETDTGREKTGPGRWTDLLYDDVATAGPSIGATIALGG